MARYKPGTIRNGVFEGMNFKDFNFVVEYTKDFNARRAAVACGMEPESGYVYRKKPVIIKAIEQILARRVEASDIDAEWVLMEAVDNVLIAKQKGQIAASNTALNIVAKHCNVDAYAAEKVHIDTADDVVQRLQRARERTAPKNDKPSFL